MQGVVILVIACAPTRTGPPAPAPVAALVAAAPRAVEAPAVAEVADAEREEVEEGDAERPAVAWPADVPPLAGAKLIEVARISASVGDSPT